MTSIQETVIGRPSSEEAQLINLRDGHFTVAAETILHGLRSGEPARILSVANPDILRDTCEVIYPKLSEVDTSMIAAADYRSELFDAYLPPASEGDPAAASALPKFATTTGQLAVAIEVMLDNWDRLAEWRTDRAYIQTIGSYNPQHLGHRDAIARTLEVAGSRASATMQIVANHPIKVDSLPPYATRFEPGERRIYSSELIDPTRVTLLDVPLSLGLAKVGYAQIELLANVMGDSEMRWLVGSDKFMTDARNVRDGKSIDKAGARFSGVHLYVARRATESTVEIDDAIDYLETSYGTKVTIVPESSNSLVLATSASKIRELRAAGRHGEADEMEFSDLALTP